jgi:hypothetical protein
MYFYYIRYSLFFTTYVCNDNSLFKKNIFKLAHLNGLLHILLHYYKLKT